MSKKIKFESFVYQFLAVANEVARQLQGGEQRKRWMAWIDSLSFEHDKGIALITWLDINANKVEHSAELAGFRFYVKGDEPGAVDKQRKLGIAGGDDPVKRANRQQMLAVVSTVAAKAGFDMPEDVQSMSSDNQRFETEEAFHDEWALSVDKERIDVRQMSEALTSPELRFIRQTLGDLEGKQLLDVGCGLGEASVYFALEGASVTAMDISQGMLDSANRLAELNGVSIHTHKSAAEQTQLDEDQQFDVIYAGNLLHHVDIAATLKLLKPHLKPGGVFVSWDPLAYNPVINAYRMIATDVRTDDEHPLKWSDIKLFHETFAKVETRYFWLTSLLVFIIMALVQRRNPNKERYWKSVVEESERWAPLYKPLETFDRFLLKFLPPLRLLCWNVVIVARN